MKKSHSIDPSEVNKFSQIAHEWWDPTGKFKPLHIFNPIRIEYITKKVKTHFGIEKNRKPFSNLDLLDIGCGGGLLSEPMRRLGANVTAIDASEKNISIAALHAKNMALDIHYQCTSVEDLSATKQQYDVILNMEVIEHVADVDSFMQHSAKLLKPGGLMFVATLNRTLKSFALAIVGAEYILRWLPRGTHDWRKFLKPQEVKKHTQNHGLSYLETQGLSYLPLQQQWIFSPDIGMNYILLCTK